MEIQRVRGRARAPLSFKPGSAASRRLIQPWIGCPAKNALFQPSLLASAPAHKHLFKLMIWQDAAERQVPHPHVGCLCSFKAEFELKRRLKRRVDFESGCIEAGLLFGLRAADAKGRAQGSLFPSADSKLRFHRRSSAFAHLRGEGW